MSEHKHTFVCENCGNEANMVIKEEAASLAEHRKDPGDGMKHKILVCRNCGNEADMTLEEIEVDE